MVGSMNVTLLYFEDCPNWRDAEKRLRIIEGENPDLRVEHHVVDTFEEAERTQFHGSPSILIDGVDPFSEDDTSVGLSCRVYQTPAGLAGSPTLDQLRNAIDDAKRGRPDAVRNRDR